MFTHRRLLQILSVIVILSMVFSGLHVPGASAQGGDGVKRQVNAQSGKVSFISPESGRVLSATRALGISAFDRPTNPGMALARRFGAEFGLKDPGRELEELKTNRSDNGRLSVRYQQKYQGIPVLGGELIVNTNERGDLYSINGEISPDISLSIQPTIDPEQAREAALQAAAKWYQKEPNELLASEPELWIFDESLLQPSTRPVELVWRLEVTAVDESLPIRELVLVNAQRSNISLHFNQVDTAWGGMEQGKTSSILNATYENVEARANGKTVNSPAERILAQTGGTTWYVTTTGSNSRTCNTPTLPCKDIQAAINKASSGDTIKVADGTYYYPGASLNSTPNVVIISGSKSLWLSGGWKATFSNQTGVSIIDGQNTNNGILATTTGQTVVQKFIIQNSRSSDSGAIYLNGGVFGLVESTIKNNTAGNRGAGVFVYGIASLSVVNSTISNNTSGSSGGGIYVESSGTVDIEYSTIAYNTSTSGKGGGIFRESGTVNVHNTILANNNGAISPNCNGLNSSDYNIISSIDGCTFTAGAHNQITTSPGISSTLLGPMSVHTLLSDSPAIDAGEPNSCTMNTHSLDERGVSRPLGDGCDIGAVEYAAGLHAFSGSNQTATAGLPFALPLTVQLWDGSETPVSGVTVTFTAPGSGASGTFPGGVLNATATTDVTGRATSPTFTANTTAGIYSVSATAVGYASTDFTLMNSNGVFVSTAGSDSNSCVDPVLPCLTINAAIQKAAAGDIVKIASGTYTGTGSQVVLINKNVRILGGWDETFTAQSGQFIIDGQGARRGVTVNSGITAFIERMVVQNGQDASSAGIYNLGTLTVTNSDVIGNNGVGISNAQGTLALNNSTVQSNAGRGIENTSGTLMVTNSTLTGNLGGLLNYYGTSTVNNSTISDNAASSGGGILRSGSGGSVTLKNTIVAGNSATGSGPDCNGTLGSAGYNLIGSTTGCTFTAGTGDLTNVDPKLGAFIGYYPLQSDSPAINVGNPATPGSGGDTCLATDQRGVTRPIGTRCDIGAYEYTAPGSVASLLIMSGDGQHLAPGTAATVPLSVIVLDGQGSPVPGTQITFTAPDSGPSGTFAPNSVLEKTVTADTFGVATAPTFTANALLGEYQVVAAAGELVSIDFNLYNAIWFVTTTGSDTNNCLSSAEPCATINGVLGKVNFRSGDTVRVADGTYTGSGNQVVLLDKSAQISGGWDAAFAFQNGWSTIDGQRSRRGVHVNSGVTVTLERFVIQNGFSTSGGGGGIANSGTLTLNHSLVRNNNGTANNTYEGGGGIANYGILTVNNSAITGNISNGNGGGLFNGTYATIILNNTTISNNYAANGGGGVTAYGTVTTNNTTISGNKAVQGFGGGIDINSGYGSDTFTIQNTLIAGNLVSSTGPDCWGTVVSAGYNLVGNNKDCTIPAATGDKIGTNAAPIDPRLVLLPSGGVSIFPNPLMAGSPAIDAGSPAVPGSGGSACLAMDQRGVGRPLGARCDIGAFEYLGSGTTPAYAVAQSGTPQYLRMGASAPFVLKVLLLDDTGNVVPNRTVTFTAPTSGASVVFAGSGNVANIVSDANGIAASPAFSANNIAGSYIVRATVAGWTGSVDFQLGNGAQVATYTANNAYTATNGTFLCDQSDPDCTGGANPRADSVQLHSIGTYLLFWNAHRRLGIDGKNMAIISTVDYCSQNECPYDNASWTGQRVIYGNGHGDAYADDVIAHEITHGVTDYEANLFYYYQSGAINESLSDLWGEYYDQSNGLGTDSEGAKWLLGEDVTGLGAIRSMSNPLTFNDPDSMISNKYWKLDDDNGGVHHNSGVNNKAVYLMVEGGTHNDITVAPLGWAKTAAIYYEVNANLLTTSSDYSDLYYALQTACTNLIGTNGITTSDCAEVKNAIDAVKMNLLPVGWESDAPVPYCDLGNPVQTVLSDGLESGRGNWTFNNGAYTRWQYDSPYGSYPYSGSHFLYADDYPSAVADASARLVSVNLPTNAFLHFAHAYGFESGTYQGTFYNYDGGVLEYSLNGGSTWSDAEPLFDRNGYSGVITSDFSNPLGDRSAFVGSSHGYINTRLDLSSLAGKNVTFRWRMGLDEAGSLWGWWIDDVKIYRCPTDPVPPASIDTLSGTPGAIAGTVTLSWTAVGDDGTTGTASSYLVRYSTSIINTENAWNAATPVTSGIPTPPQAPLGVETMTVSGLVPGQTYYFAVRAQDEEPNLGGLSNSPEVVAKPIEPLTPGIYNDNDLTWVYSGTWTVASQTGGPYDNDYRYTNVQNANARIAFVGKLFTVYFSKFNNRGEVRVVIDGGTPNEVQYTFSEYGPSLAWKQSWTLPTPLATNGPHTVEFRKVSASTSVYIDIDAIRIYEPDITAPGTISNLQAETGTSLGAVNLSWPAVGDDGTAGTAASYLVRYSSEPINDTNWDSATAFANTLVPQTFGQTEHLTVTGLAPGQTYYFAVRARDEQLNQGGLSNSPSAVAYQPPPMGPGTYDDKDPAWTFSSGWSTASQSGPYSGSFHYTNTQNANAAFSFTGTDFKVWFSRNTNRGEIQVVVDRGTANQQTHTISTYHTALQWQQGWSLPAPLATDGPHTVEFIKTSSSTSVYVDLDAITIKGPVGEGLYDDADTAWAYAGSWAGTTGQAGPYSGTYHYTNAQNASASLAFTGTEFTVYFSKYSNRGDIQVVIDRGTATEQTHTISTNNASLLWQQKWTLPEPLATTGPHTVEFIKSSANASIYIDIDAIRIGPIPSVMPGTYNDNHAAWVYSGTWTVANQTGGPYDNDYRYTNVQNASASLTFTGKLFTVYFSKYTNRGEVRVVIDGGTPNEVQYTFSEYGPSLAWKQSWTLPTPLATNGPHTVEFRKVSPSTGVYIDIDYIVIEQ